MGQLWLPSSRNLSLWILSHRVGKQKQAEPTLGVLLAILHVFAVESAFKNSEDFPVRLATLFLFLSVVSSGGRTQGIEGSHQNEPPEVCPECDLSTISMCIKEPKIRSKKN